MLKNLRFNCPMFDGGSLNTLIKMEKFRFKHGKVKELHVRRHCIETSSSTSRSKSHYALPTANELAFLFFSSIFPDCNRLYNANAPVVKSSGWLRCQGTRSDADRNADHKAKSGPNVLISITKKRVRNTPAARRHNIALE